MMQQFFKCLLHNIEASSPLMSHDDWLDLFCGWVAIQIKIHLENFHIDNKIAQDFTTLCKENCRVCNLLSFRLLVHIHVISMHENSLLRKTTVDNAFIRFNTFN